MLTTIEIIARYETDDCELFNHFLLWDHDDTWNDDLWTHECGLGWLLRDVQSLEDPDEIDQLLLAVCQEADKAGAHTLIVHWDGDGDPPDRDCGEDENEDAVNGILVDKQFVDNFEGES